MSQVVKFLKETVKRNYRNFKRTGGKKVGDSGKEKGKELRFMSAGLGCWCVGSLVMVLST